MTPSTSSVQLPASTTFLASVLGRGVEAAAVMPYESYEALLNSMESISETFDSEDRLDFATYQIVCVQIFEHSDRREIEVKVSASNGLKQLCCYIYVRSDGIEDAI